MATLTLKNVPDQLVKRLEIEARQNRRSLTQETLLRLEGSLEARRRTPEETVAALRQLHQRLAHLPPLTDDFLDRAKREGRP